MFKARLKFQKRDAARFISHLDLMKVFQRSFARATLPVWQTEGFNRHIYVSIARPLPVGVGGEREILDFHLLDEGMPPEEVLSRLNAALPRGIQGVALYGAERPAKEIAFGEYRVTLAFDSGISPEMPDKIRLFLENPQTMLVKKSKSGEKTVRLPDFLKSSHVGPAGGNGIALGMTLAAGEESLNPAAVIAAMEREFLQGKTAAADVVRLRLLDGGGEEFF